MRFDRRPTRREEARTRAFWMPILIVVNILIVYHLGCGNLSELIKNPQGGGGDFTERLCIRGQIKDQAAVDFLNSQDWKDRGNPPVKIRDRILARECSELLKDPPRHVLE